ncbi:lipopolysaccharide biosynthesis protein [Candidatus Laterigemmans baculatus]|uniref:lipopolysaccharide biosynthesis protein n=1 Tax=Candidatus Laterigemmans baculatus TaxID=2770505 RepID=UPI00193BC2FB|nr:lipopolysaccharide biosynthesis protein [Candidatus Laterigemmans baculatus]
MQETAWLALGKLLAAVGAIAAVRFLTDALPPAEYGDLMLGVSGAMLAQSFLFSPLSTTLQRFYIASCENETGWGYWRAAMLALSVVIGLVLLVGLALILGLTVMGHWETWPLIAATILFAIAVGVGGIFDGIQNAARNRRLVAVHQAIDPWLRIGMALALTTWMGAIGWAGMAGFALASALTVGSRWWFFQPQRQAFRRQSGSVRESRIEMLAYAWPIVCWGFCLWVTGACDRWTLRIFSDAAEVGQYAVLFQLGIYPLLMITDLVQQLLSPLFFSRAGDGRDRQRMQNVFQLQWYVLAGTFPLVIAATATAWLLSDWILYFFAAPAYRDCAPLLPLMTFAGGLAASERVAGLALVCGRSVQPLLPVRVGGSLLICGLCLIGGAWQGMTGIVGALLAGHAVMCAWTLWLVRREGAQWNAPRAVVEPPLATAA